MDALSSIHPKFVDAGDVGVHLVPLGDVQADEPGLDGAGQLAVRLIVAVPGDLVDGAPGLVLRIPNLQREGLGDVGLGFGSGMQDGPAGQGLDAAQVEVLTSSWTAVAANTMTLRLTGRVMLRAPAGTSSTMSNR